MKRIAIILPSSLPIPTVKGGAVETLVEDFILENEIQTKFEIVVYSEYDKQAKNLSHEYKYTQIFYIKMGFLYNILNFPIRFLKRFFNIKIEYLKILILKYQLKKNNFDFVIIQGLINHLSSVAKVVPHEKIILHLHADIIKPENKPYFDEINLFKGNIVVVSDYINKRLMENLSVNPNQITVIKNCVSKQFVKFNNNAFIEHEKVRLEISEDVFVILFVGRLVEDKGIQHLIKAVNSIKEGKHLKLIVVGSFGSNFGSGEKNDNFSQETIKLANESKGRVVFTGFVNNLQKKAYYEIADVVVIPSLCNDAAPLVSIEALACGKPIIASNRGGIPEYVKDDIGLLIETNENFIKKLSEALIKMEDKKLRDKMSHETQKYYKAYQSERFYNDYVNLLNDINVK